jgi:hypothetical protein
VIPGYTVSFMLLAQTTAGIPAAGLTLSGITVTGTLNGAGATVAPALTEVDTVGAWRRYKLDITIPALSGAVSWFTVTAQPVAQNIVFDTLRCLEGEIEAVDLASLYSVVASPVVSVVADGGPSGDISWRFVKNTYSVLSFTVKDQSGNVIDLSGYTVPTLGIKSQDQVATTYTQTTGITRSAAGLVTITVPESASFYSALTTGQDSATLYWTFVANEAGDATKTRCLSRGQLTILRNEV